MSNSLKIATIILGLTLCGTSVEYAVAQTPAEGKQRPAVIKYDGHMATMLLHLTSIYGVTIGLEVDPSNPSPNVDFYLQEPTLSDVLNALTKSSATYHWREQDGCVEVMPATGSNPLLDTYISYFRVDAADDLEAINMLVNLPEVQAGMKASGLNYREPANSLRRNEAKRVSINLSGVTMRQVLNHIANENDTRFWIFRKHNSRSFSINTVP